MDDAALPVTPPSGRLAAARGGLAGTPASSTIQQGSRDRRLREPASTNPRPLAANREADEATLRTPTGQSVQSDAFPSRRDIVAS
jgi:hypothetical protein